MSQKTTAYARKRRDEWQKTRHLGINPVTEAVMVAGIKADITHLQTSVELQAWAGSDAQKIVNQCGRLVYVVGHAAHRHGLDDTPEARILRAASNVLGELADDPESLERQRASIQGCTLAIERLMPSLSVWALAYGQLELEQLLKNTQGMTTADLARAIAP